jgi:hypothetical protein
MKAKAEKILSTASYVLVNLIKDGKRDHLSNDELTDIAIDMTTKLIEKIPDDEPNENDEYDVPTDEECVNAVKAALRVMNDRASTKSQLVNAIVLKYKVKKMIAEYIISRAEGLGVIKAKPRGNCTDYKLIK